MGGQSGAAVKTQPAMPWRTPPASLTAQREATTQPRSALVPDLQSGDQQHQAANEA